MRVFKLLACWENRKDSQRSLARWVDEKGLCCVFLFLVHFYIDENKSPISPAENSHVCARAASERERRSKIIICLCRSSRRSSEKSGGGWPCEF